MNPKQKTLNTVFCKKKKKKSREKLICPSFLTVPTKTDCHNDPYYTDEGFSKGVHYKFPCSESQRYIYFEPLNNAPVWVLNLSRYLISSNTITEGDVD